MKSFRENKETQGQRISDLIQHHRKKSGLTVSDIARYVGVPPATIRHYELGGVAVPLRHLYAIANCLEISPDKVLKILEKS